MTLRAAMIDLLRCPQSGKSLRLENPGGGERAGETGALVCSDGPQRYPIRNEVPRFVPESNYADNFGMQWNKFSRTQLDSHSGHPISADRFWGATAWSPADLKGKRVLDIGCGAGRFAEVAARAGADVVALDYSTAVDACHANLAHFDNVLVIQGDIYAPPLREQSFDFVYSLGVLQHTPDVERAFKCLPPLVAPGGRLCVDFYEKSWKSALLPKYWLRPFTKRMPKSKLFSLLEVLVPTLLPASSALAKIPVIGRQLKRIVPVANYAGELPLDHQQQLEWSLLDTFDWLSPEFDNPQNAATVRSWLEDAGMESIEVLKAGHLVGRGVKPKRLDAAPT
jgi:2-polyprenyl-3-methyl-5-hydroxy-6-metoxy-1,4-benzoquinol methylase